MTAKRFHQPRDLRWNILTTLHLWPPFCAVVLELKKKIYGLSVQYCSALPSKPIRTHACPKENRSPHTEVGGLKNPVLVFLLKHACNMGALPSLGWFSRR